ncbi:MAG: KpsF/GutQ family sugar-phosphate isomerase [Candidatus Omnitrophica bacterium]|nr:KpsF/GutQ family sugar-phosphate isomerase [Candidatus Omnitrophota bacterium]MBU4487837.1 KpsF/GutQ family sugar-phosphate isomerase [Candidatus Omnitrophota bacterium]MCG2704620.1 KpsF/GutQ family sugar-phosphate isomerase [Candidatus Omnitrophota bacterium]
MSIKKAKEVLKIEAKAIQDLIKRIDSNFVKAVKIVLKTKGHVIVTGMGKPGFIAQKISATFSSTGTPSIYLHPAEALHGDLGRVTKNDCLIAISNSGETEEIISLLPIVKRIGATLIAMVGNVSSTLARNADCVLNVGINKEACPFGLAPTTSTTVMLAMGDALSVAVQAKKGFKIEHFALYHPGGNLGKRLLLRVKDIMRKGDANPVAREDELVREILLKITRARAGSASIVDKSGVLRGIFTDGDLRRQVRAKGDITRKRVKEVMTKNPITIGEEAMAIDALRILQSKKIDEMPVVDRKGRPAGLLDVQDLLKAGLV